MRRLCALGVFLAAAAAIGLTLARAQGVSRPGDWPQWRGPNRDGLIAAFTPPKVWPDRLTPAWKVTVGLGYATTLVVGPRVYMFARQESNEVMIALEAATGRIVWQRAYPAPVTMNRAAARHGEGPKSTPAFADGRLFSLGYGGIVTAWDAATGRIQWQKTGLASPTFGTAQSPIVDRGLVILHVGGNNGDGALSAFEAATGEVKWSWTGDGPGYGSPMVADLGGTRQVIVQTQRNLVSVSAATGELLWQRSLTSPSQQNSITVILDGQTIVSSALQNPMTAFTVAKSGSGWTTADVWSNPDVPLYMSNAVLVRGAIFGMTNRGSGQFFCVDAATGRTLWTSEPRQATNAAVLAAGDHVLFLKDNAELIVARASTTAFEPLRTYSVADSATWSAPSIAGQRLLVKDVSTLGAWEIRTL
jgi:outer membrane protein assembly factor BamB